MKQTQDKAPKSDKIEAGVIELDIWGELIHKRVVHGYVLNKKLRYPIIPAISAS